MDTLKLVELTKKDYPDLYDFMHDVWVDTYSHIIPLSHIELLLHKYFDADNIPGFLSKGYKYYYIFDKENAGLLVYADKIDEIYLDKLYVLPEHRGKGYAAFALTELKKLGKDITLNVNRNNERAVTVYKRLGFEIEKVVDIIVSDENINEDYVMRLKV